MNRDIRIHRLAFGDRATNIFARVLLERFERFFVERDLQVRRVTAREKLTGQIRMRFRIRRPVEAQPTGISRQHRQVQGEVDNEIK
jgi:hypothetical protein